MYKWHSGYMRKQNADIRKMLWEDRQYKKLPEARYLLQIECCRE